MKEVVLLVLVRPKFGQSDVETREDVEQSLKDLQDYEIVRVEVTK